jgi:hypothetical protein
MQAVKPFISSGDINKGNRWSDTLAHELNDSQFGIICLTPYNIDAAWINFEAGALSKIIDRSFVSPFLFGVDSATLNGPLSQFQSTIFDKKDIFNLLTSINNRFDPDIRLEQELLRNEFEKWWENLKQALDAIPETHEKASSGYDWLLFPKELVMEEASENTKSVWIITKDIYQHALEPKIADIVIKNIVRGVTYRYITPESNYIDGGVKEALDHVSSDPNKLQVKPIPDQEFNSQAVTDYILLNPTYDKNYHLQVYLKLPINEKEKDFWIKVDEEAAIGFFDRFEKMWERKETIIKQDKEIK